MMVPSGRNDGLSPASPSTVEPARMPSSRARSTPGTGDDQVVVEAGAPRRRGRRSCERAANSSWRSREIANRSASASLASPSETVHSAGIRSLTSRQPSVVDTAVTLPAGKARDGLGSTHGARVIDSTPPATTTSASPDSTVREAIIAASRLEPHSRLTVVAGTEVGSPASSTAIRPTLRLSSPAPLALPHTTSPIRGRVEVGRLGQHPAQRGGGQVVGAHLGQRAAEAAEGGAGGGVQEGGRHGASLGRRPRPRGAAGAAPGRAARARPTVPR